MTWRPWPTEQPEAGFASPSPPWVSIAGAVTTRSMGDDRAIRSGEWLSLTSVARHHPERLLHVVADHNTLTVPSHQQARLLLALIDEVVPDPRSAAISLGSAIAAVHGLARWLLHPEALADLHRHPVTLEQLATTPHDRGQLMSAACGGVASSADLPAFRGVVARLLVHSQHRWRKVPHDATPGLPPDHPLRLGLHQAVDHLISVAQVQAWLAPSPLPAPTDVRDAAVRWLVAPGRIELATEHQAFGFDGDPQPRTESRWLAARIRLSLHRAGVDQTAPLTRLLAQVGTDPPRWYDHWQGIPADADSLATWMEVCCTVHHPVPDTWLAPLRALPPETPTSTWFSEGTPDWGGPECPAVRVRLSHALAGLPSPTFDAVLEANLASFRLEGTVFHYPRARYLGLALQLWARLQQARPILARRHATWGAELVHQCEDLLLSAAGCPGPMATATILRALAWVKPDSLAISTGLRYLGRTQRPDGSWLAEPAFVIPGRPPHASTFLHNRALTTAVCVEGWAAAQEPRREPRP